MQPVTSATPLGVRPMAFRSSQWAGGRMRVWPSPSRRDRMTIWSSGPLELAQPGDVLVICRRPSPTRPGEVSAPAASAPRGKARRRWSPTGRAGSGRHRRVRAAGLRRRRQPTKDGPGESTCRSPAVVRVVHPGDIMVGDRDGVVVVPRHDAAAVIALERIRSYETARLEAIARGDFFARTRSATGRSRRRFVDAPAMPGDRNRSCSAPTPRCSIILLARDSRLP